MTDSYLSHYGVKGMKWGVRRGKKVTGVTRHRGALIDRNNELASKVNKARSGEKYRYRAALGKKLVGEEQQKKNWDALLKNLDSQNTRLRTGKLTVADRIDMTLNVGALDLLVARKP